MYDRPHQPSLHHACRRPLWDAHLLRRLAGQGVGEEPSRFRTSGVVGSVLRSDTASTECES